ncbi:MAG: AAA family ATPase [Myxococcales bacterium]|nr:AAA family ATPase [Myxococcales bacterium]
MPPMKETSAEAPLYLKRLVVENWRCFGKAEIDFMRGSRHRPHTILVGRNGSGKTSVLRAIALGLAQQREASALMGELAGDFVRRNKQGRFADQATIALDFHDPEARTRTYRTITTIRRDSSGQETVEKTLEPARFPWQRIFVGGYGVNRGARHRESRSSYQRLAALRSLFSDDTPLLDPEATLRAIKLAALEERGRSRASKGPNVLDKTLSQLRALLQLAPAHKIEISPTRVLVHGPWGAMPFHALGDGYRGTAGWVLDMLGMALATGTLANVKDVRGIVLIDEIDEHLHPSWQKKLLSQLASRFRNLQIVGTTHSPMTLVDCAPDELVACELVNAVARLHTDLGGPSGRTADEILRGEWFGLSSTLDTRTEKLLGEYQAAVESKKSEKKLEELRRRLRERLGRRFDSPLDELALQIAAEVRQQYRDAVSAEERRRLVAEAAQRLREQAAAGGIPT